MSGREAATGGPTAAAQFTLSLPGRISFGTGCSAQLGPAVRAFGTRVLLVTGGNPSRYADLISQLRAGVAEFCQVSAPAEPTVADARAAAIAGRAGGVEVVVALGGGSAIDLAKAAALLVANGGDPLDYLEVVRSGQAIPGPALPVVALPTTSGTGAEVTANAVLASPEHGLKASLRHPGMVPRVALVDPLLTVGCPPAVTASAGMDALTQCLEPFVSNRANPVTDGWATTGLSCAGRSLRTAFATGEDVAARTDMALASLLGGLALANSKLGAVHGFAGVLGGMSGAPHGAICAALLEPVCRANLAAADPALAARFTQIAQLLTGDPRATASDGLAWLAQTREALGIPGLGAYGLEPGAAAEVAAKTARASSTQGNPVVLDEETLRSIYLSAL